MTRQSIWQLIKSVCACAADLAMESGSEHAEHAAAQLRACSPHWMRHTFASRLMKSGTNLVTVQDLMDHASVSTTSGYLHVGDAEKRSALEKMAAAAPG